ncbi:FAD-dependent oxidoreductase [Devosia albogilva]|uniref:FAD-dependent oxidoreductase n=1 Tax=Devosia albogilva TaxID=429726 RepID=A0ABW5QIE0_9HYPH
MTPPRTSPPVRFRFDGREIAARDGDSLAAALAENGITRLHSTSAGSSRGIFCGMGVCQDCLLEVDGQRSQRACMTKVRNGMDVRTQDDGRFAQPPSLQKADPAPEPRIETMVLVIGAGPAGLVAAIACREMGLDVLVIDERDAAGGQYFKPRSAASRHTRRADAQHRSGDGLRARAAGLDIRLQTTVWSARRGSDERFDVHALGPQGRLHVVARALLLATGAYELPALVPGWTLPGVMSIGAGQTLVRRYGVAPGKRTLIAGNGPLGLQLGAEILALGGTVLGIIERSRPASGAALAAAVVSDPALVMRGAYFAARMSRARVPMLWGWQVGRIEGGDSLTVEIEQLDGGNRRSIETDALCIGEGFAPQIELARLLDCPMDLRDGIAVPRRAADGSTPVTGVWIAGDGGGLGGAQLAEEQGRTSAASIARWLGEPAPIEARAHRTRQIERFQKALWQLYAAPPRQAGRMLDDLVVCRCENVSAGQVRQAIGNGAQDPGGVKRATRLGMGRCQGRYCTRPVLGLLEAAGRSVDANSLFAPQLPARPLPLRDVTIEKPEWSGHRESRPSARPSSQAQWPLGGGHYDLAVIGAGVTGLAAAREAALAGAKVIVLDQGQVGAEASGGNAGSLHLQLLSWDFGAKAFAGGSAALRTLALQKQSIALWGELETTLAANFEMKVTGGLMVAENPAQIDFLKRKAAAEATVGIETQVLDRAEVLALVPHLSADVVAGAWCPGEGKINPLPATLALARSARASGAEIETLARVTDLVAEPGRYRIDTARGAVSASRMIIAAGGWSAELGRHLGVDLPVRGAPLQMLVTEPAPPLLPCLLAHADRHLTMKQGANGTVLIGGAWTAETSATGQPRVLLDSIEGNLWVACRTVPAIAGLSLVRSWAAMNIDIDGAPLLSTLPGHSKVVVAATANGFTLGPLMGREAARLAMTGQAAPELAPFTLSRF